MDNTTIEEDLKLLDECTLSLTDDIDKRFSKKLPSPKTREEEALILSDEPIRYNEESHCYESCKRRLSEEDDLILKKIPKLSFEEHQTLDNEVSEITSLCKRKMADNDIPLTSASNLECSSPRKVTKRSSSTDKTPLKTKTINDGADRAQKYSEDILESSSDILKPMPLSESISEECDFNDSQNIRLVLSPTTDTSLIDNSKKCDVLNSSSDPVVVKDRTETLQSGKIKIPQSEGFSYSEQSNLSQNLKDFNDKTTDQDSTDSVCSMIDSPENMPSVASKLISKLSNGNSSTPTEIPGGKHNDNESDCTPDMIKLNGQKGLSLKKDAFRGSNTTTPSTISPFQNGHGIPLSTPQIPTFDLHLSHNEDGEFLSLYIVRTDNDLGMDMCKEYQRFSRRYTIDPYMADVSVSNSPSSVTSGGMINLPNRPSFASIVSSTSSTSSNRTSDGAFVVPQPPKKTISTSGTSTVKGYECLMKKLQDLFLHMRDSSIDEPNHFTGDDKVSVGIQASSPSSANSNGDVSPDEMGDDKTTPKSSLKKTRVRGRRPLAGKTKRALLPTQIEESETPEMVVEDNDKSVKDDKLIATPKSVSKLKQKRSRPASPRPGTPIEKAPANLDTAGYPGYPPDTVVLARWVDKRYYSGRVVELIEPYKYMIKFDDGHVKALLDDFIVFGDMNVLPLIGKSVFFTVNSNGIYEPAIVLDIVVEEGVHKYRCTDDSDDIVCVKASQLYLTEDQVRSIKETSLKSPPATPLTPRRRGLRELDLDNIIHGPRSARMREKPTPTSAKKRVASPRSPKASTSGLKSSTPSSSLRKRVTSESSSVSESSNPAPPPPKVEHIAGVEPEVQKTPKKIDGVKAGPLQLKGAAKQNLGKKNVKLTKLENDALTISLYGPMPDNNKLFEGHHFILTCSDPPKKINKPTTTQESRHYSSEEDGESTSTMAGTDCEDFQFCDRPFFKERLREQLTAGGGTVYSTVYDMPLSKNLNMCYLIAPRPCRTAKYLSCAAANVRAVCHSWVLSALETGELGPIDDYILPAGWSLCKNAFVNWDGVTGKRSVSIFKDTVILFCGDHENFVKFWERICSHCGATTRVVNEEDMNMSGALAIVTEWDCPHEVQNKANQENIPMVSITWVQECIIEGRIIPPTSHDKFSFMYAEPE